MDSHRETLSPLPTSSPARPHPARWFAFRRHLDGRVAPDSMAGGFEAAWRFAWAMHFEDAWPGWGTPDCDRGLGAITRTSGIVVPVQVEIATDRPIVVHDGRP